MESQPTVYYFYTSFYSQKVLMFLREKEVKFDGHLVNLPGGETQSSWFLEINPKGEVPAMKVGDEIINGSDNILEFLENNNLGKRSILPTDPEHLSKNNYFLEKFKAVPIDAISYGTAYFPHIRTVKKGPVKWPLTIMMKRKMDNRSADLRSKAAENAGKPAEAALLAKAEEHDKRYKLFADENEHKRLLKELRELLDEVEEQLSIQKDKQWLFGDEFYAADCVLAIILQRLFFLGHEDYMSAEVRPMLSKWWDGTRKRESFLKSTWSPNLPLLLLKTKLGLV